MIRIETERIKNNADHYSKLTRSNWSPIIQPSGVGEEFWLKLFKYFPEYQLFYETHEGEWLGFANTIPIRFDDSLEDLPEEGWDWLIEKGIKDYENGTSPNILGGLQVGINPQFRGQGWSKKILEEAKISMRIHGFKQFILPIRPTLKYLYPTIPMEEYITWEKDGKIFDPWIRTHINAGAGIIKVCHKAMEVSGTLQEWELWAGKTFSHSGSYPVDGALSLVNIDVENRQGLYLEPNIWIYYE